MPALCTYLFLNELWAKNRKSIGDELIKEAMHYDITESFDISKYKHINQLPDLNLVECQAFKGPLLLQLLWAKDILKSGYSHIHKFDIYGTELEKSQSFSHENRYLTVTDGYQIFHAFEFDKFVELIYPGCKILIHGEFEVRYGIILLRKNNCQYLGGHVFNLIQKYKYNNDNNFESHLLPMDKTLQPSSQNNCDVVVEKAIPNISLIHNGNVKKIMDLSCNVGTEYNLETDNMTLKQPATNKIPQDNLPCNNVNNSILDLSHLEITAVNGPHPNSFKPITNKEIIPISIDLDETFADNILDLDDTCLNIPSPVSPDKKNEDTNTLEHNRKMDQLNYLIHISTWLNNDQNQNMDKTDVQKPFIIMGMIHTLLTKLQRHPQAGWVLQVKLTDGTGCVDAFISNNVLTELATISSFEFEKLSMNKDETSRKKKLQIITDFQRKLINMYGCFYLEKNEDKNITVCKYKFIEDYLINGI